MEGSFVNYVEKLLLSVPLFSAHSSINFLNVQICLKQCCSKTVSGLVECSLENPAKTFAHNLKCFPLNFQKRQFFDYENYKSLKVCPDSWTAVGTTVPSFLLLYQEVFAQSLKKFRKVHFIQFFHKMCPRTGKMQL